MNIPAFKNTNEAIEWGYKFYQDMDTARELNNKATFYQRLIKLNPDNLSFCFSLQFIHEALDMCLGKMLSCYLACLPKEIKKSISRGGFNERI